MANSSSQSTNTETFFAVAALARDVLASNNVVDAFALSDEQIALLETLAHHASCVAQEARFAQESLQKLIRDEEERERGEALAYEQQIRFSGPFFDLGK
jgi:hypothetical protein